MKRSVNTVQSNNLNQIIAVHIRCRAQLPPSGEKVLILGGILMVPC